MKISTSYSLVRLAGAIVAAALPPGSSAQQSASVSAAAPAAGATAPEWVGAQAGSDRAPDGPSIRFSSKAGYPGQGLSRNNLSSYYSRAEPPPTPLVLRFGPTSEEKESQLEEDTKVMSLLLDESLDRALESAPSSPQPGAAIAPGRGSSIRGIIVDGYGAIFRINVNFPLVGSDDRPKNTEPKTKDSEWEATKRQLYSDPTAGPTQGGWRNSGAPEYNADTVATVENALTHCLKNGSHLRGLDANDNIVISVQGASLPYSATATTGMGSGMGGGGGGVGNFGVGGFGGGVGSFSSGGAYGPGATTYLSIRAKKSDIDAFASGALKFEDFKGKVTVAAYSTSRNKPANEGAVYENNLAPVPAALKK
jgi:hypothetical protein